MVLEDARFARTRTWGTPIRMPRGLGEASGRGPGDDDETESDDDGSTTIDGHAIDALWVWRDVGGMFGRGTGEAPPESVDRTRFHHEFTAP